MCCRHRPTIFRREKCNSRRRRSIPPIFPLEVRGSVSGRHFFIGRKHYPSSFSFLHIKNCSSLAAHLKTSTVDREAPCGTVRSLLGVRPPPLTLV